MRRPQADVKCGECGAAGVPLPHVNGGVWGGAGAPPKTNNKNKNRDLHTHSAKRLRKSTIGRAILRIPSLLKLFSKYLRAKLDKIEFRVSGGLPVQTLTIAF